MSDVEDTQHIYENVGDAVQGDDDAGWSSSEFEEECDEDQRSVGTHSQNSQSSVDRAKTKAKNLLRRVPARLSWGKPGSDLQSVVRCHYMNNIFTALHGYMDTSACRRGLAMGILSVRLSVRQTRGL